MLRKALLMLDYSCTVEVLECFPPFCQEGETSELGLSERETVQKRMQVWQEMVCCNFKLADLVSFPNTPASLMEIINAVILSLDLATFTNCIFTVNVQVLT